MQVAQILGDRDHVRVDCPSCGGNHTLSISRSGAGIVWSCFRNSCNVKGAKNEHMTAADIRNMLARKSKKTPVFKLPDNIIKGVSNNMVREYLIKNHCMHAVESYAAGVGYDPDMNRVVFYNSGGATGRALNPHDVPKWYIYPDSQRVPFVVGGGSTAVLVEDCASACAISSNDKYTGVALMGTNYFPEYTKYLQDFDHVVIALDKDARVKNFELKEYLTNHFDCVNIWLLNTDLKYIDCTDEQKLLEAKGHTDE